MKINKIFTLCFGFAAALMISGCSATGKGVPVSGTYLDIGSMDRNDYTVLDKVEATSDEISILFGLFKIIDSNKIEFLYVPFFEEKVAYQNDDFFQYTTPLSRAYYKVLEKSPNADTVLKKSVDAKSAGIPLIFTHTKVTYHGKAIKLKTDKELGK